MKGFPEEKVNLVMDQSDESGKIARIFLNSPRNLNAIDRALYEEIRTSLEIIAEEEDIRAVILSSDVNTTFSAGVDVKFIQTLTDEEASYFFADLSNLFDEIAHFPRPTIALVNGYTFGAGADLALSCDLRIATASTVFRFPGPQFGLILGTQRLINEIGAQKARFLTLTNKKVDSQTALHYGLVHEVCPDLNAAGDLISNWIKAMQRVPFNTVQTLKQLCAGQSKSACDLTRDSVLYGDFRQRFCDYITK